MHDDDKVHAVCTKTPEFIPVPAVWMHYDGPPPAGEPQIGVRLLGSLDHPGDFVLQILEVGNTLSVRIPPDVLQELHRQARVVDTSHDPAGVHRA